ncbi:MAG: hypothetical protein HY393_01750 [Candidatus Diapherotrites archaeon]|nr:hypothetical protein [Candidatus Diapherotrites archaeon]
MHEAILKRAGHGLNAHRIARRKEFEYLQRTGQLNPFMKWLKHIYPTAYRERVKAWKFKPAQ